MSWPPKGPFLSCKLSVLMLMAPYLLLPREGRELPGLWTMAEWDVVAQSWCSLGNTELAELGQGGSPAPVKVRCWELRLVLPCFTGPQGPF